MNSPLNYGAVVVLSLAGVAGGESMGDATGAAFATVVAERSGARGAQFVRRSGGPEEGGRNCAQRAGLHDRQR